MSAFSRIHPIVRLWLVLLVAALTLVACDTDLGVPTPTVEGIEELDPLPDRPTQAPSVTLQPTTSPTVVVAILETPLPTFTPLPPSLTPTPTETPGPYEHVVQPGETLLAIVQLYGYRSPAIMSVVVALNANLPSADALVAGQTILIPRQTNTPTPPGFEVTLTTVATLGIDLPRAIPTNAVIDCHTVEEGETIISIAQDYATTIEILAELNPAILFSGCDFNNRSGGENCIVSIVVGQCVNVPFPTPTPTLSPTPSGDETATPTPTYPPPRVVSPPDGWTLRGSVPLQWVSVGLLQPDEYYFVEVTDTERGEVFTEATRVTSLDLPLDLMPPAGEQRRFTWRVLIAAQTENGTFREVGISVPTRSFVWQGP